MTVPAEKLIRMAEQIAANVSIGQDQDIIALKLVDHIKRFWDPRMRAQFLEHAESHSADFSPVLAAATKILQEAS